jgi:hypothetical protein
VTTARITTPPATTRADTSLTGSGNENSFTAGPRPHVVARCTGHET